MTRIPNPIESSALARPDHPALVSAEGSLWTYAQLRHDIQQRAAALVELGIQQGDTVALLGNPSFEWIASFHAIGWIGAVAMPVPSTAIEQEIRRLIKGLPPKLLWVGQSHAHVLDPLRESVHCAPFSKVAGEPLLQETLWDLEDIRLIVHTSGSTGTPRAIRLTTGQLLFNAMGSSIRLGHHLDDQWLNCLPLHHMGGLSILLRSAFLGTTQRLAHPFCATTINSLIDHEGITQISVVPTMLLALIDDREERPFPASLRVILTGGAPCGDEILTRAEKMGAPISLTWGMTEAASQITTRLPGDYSPESGVGAPLAFARVLGGESRLSVVGPIVSGGSILTSDVGRVSPSGAVHVHHRSDRVIVSGGENIDPCEIEATLNQLSEIAEAVVVDVPHQKWGQRPVAFLVATQTIHEDYDVLKSTCQGQLARFKVPDQFFWLNSFPRTSLGKVAYGQLRGLARAILAGQKPQSLEVGAKLVGYSAGLEGFEVDNGVNELNGCAKAFVGAEDGVFKRYRVGSQIGNGHDDSESVAHSHGSFEVGFGVNQGHSPTAVIKNGAEAVLSGQEHLLKGGVAVLKHPTEKGNSGAVDFVESNGDGVFETHRDSSVLEINPKEVV